MLWRMSLSTHILHSSHLRCVGEEDVTEIEVKPDGSWRAESEDDRKSLGDLGQWHLPDGTLSPPTPTPMEVDSKPKLEALKQEQVKQEGGFWEVRKPDNLNSLSSGNKLPENFINNNNVIPRSSSATGSSGEVNQDGGVG
ncbi:hypothetical protein LXL04_005522 [Taraxacum kok-saghyz]